MKFLFEGEEEIGSPHLAEYVTEHAAELTADLVISADGAMWRPGEPSLSVGSKGLVAMDIIVEGARPTCIPAGSAALWPTRCTHSAESLASLHRLTAASRCRLL